MKNSLFLVFISFFACNNPTTDTNNQSREWALIDRLKVLDKPLKKPVAGDWLFEHKEAGQTFEQYQKAAPVIRWAQLKAFYQQHGLMRDYKTASEAVELLN